MLDKAEKKQIITKFAKAANDSGSCEVQIGLLTERINQISKHLKSFPKDVHSQRGLLLLVGKRHSLTNYLKKHDKKSYVRVMSLLQDKKEVLS